MPETTAVFIVSKATGACYHPFEGNNCSCIGATSTEVVVEVAYLNATSNAVSEGLLVFCGSEPQRPVTPVTSVTTTTTAVGAAASGGPAAGIIQSASMMDLGPCGNDDNGDNDAKKASLVPFRIGGSNLGGLYALFSVAVGVVLLQFLAAVAIAVFLKRKPVVVPPARKKAYEILQRRRSSGLQSQLALSTFTLDFSASLAASRAGANKKEEGGQEHEVGATTAPIPAPGVEDTVGIDGTKATDEAQANDEPIDDRPPETKTEALVRGMTRARFPNLSLQAVSFCLSGICFEAFSIMNLESVTAGELAAAIFAFLCVLAYLAYFQIGGVLGAAMMDAEIEKAAEKKRLATKERDEALQAVDGPRGDAAVGFTAVAPPDADDQRPEEADAGLEADPSVLDDVYRPYRTAYAGCPSVVTFFLPGGFWRATDGAPRIALLRAVMDQFKHDRIRFTAWTSVTKAIVTVAFVTYRPPDTSWCSTVQIVNASQLFAWALFYALVRPHRRPLDNLVLAVFTAFTALLALAPVVPELAAAAPILYQVVLFGAVASVPPTLGIQLLELFRWRRLEEEAMEYEAVGLPYPPPPEGEGEGEGERTPVDAAAAAALAADDNPFSASFSSDRPAADEDEESDRPASKAAAATTTEKGASDSDDDVRRISDVAFDLTPAADRMTDPPTDAKDQPVIWKRSVRRLLIRRRSTVRPLVTNAPPAATDTAPASTAAAAPDGDTLCISDVSDLEP